MPYTPLFQRNPSVKPTYANYGSGVKENDPIYPPAPTMPNADEYNELGGTDEGLVIMTGLATIVMSHSAGTYSKVAGKAINKNFVLGTTLSGVGSGDLTVTKNSTGDLTFQFATGIIPTIEIPPIVSFNHTSMLFRNYNSQIVDGRTVRIRIGDPVSNGVADALFTLYVMLCLCSQALLHLEC